MESQISILDKTKNASKKAIVALLDIINESNFERNLMHSNEEKNNLKDDSLDQSKPFCGVVTDNFEFSIKENTIDYTNRNLKNNTFKKGVNDAGIYNPINDLNNDDSFINQRNDKKFVLGNTPE